MDQAARTADLACACVSRFSSGTGATTFRFLLAAEPRHSSLPLETRAFRVGYVKVVGDVREIGAGCSAVGGRRLRPRLLATVLARTEWLFPEHT